MKELKVRKGRPPITDDEELIAEKIRKAQARNADRAARKIDDLWKNYFDLAFPKEGVEIKDNIKLSATDKLFKMLQDFQNKVELGDEEQQETNDKKDDDNTIKVNFG